MAFAILWIAILCVTGGHPWAFALGIDLRLSNSQTQLYLWFLVLSTVYLADLYLRVRYTGYFAGIGVPAKLLALSGVSALTFGAARANTTLKVAINPDSAAVDKAPATGLRCRLEYLKDLFTSDQGSVDLGDFQMIALTGVAILVYVVVSTQYLTRLACAGHIDLPQVDDTLLGGTAASQGAYLLKKFGSPLGH